MWSQLKHWWHRRPAYAKRLVEEHFFAREQDLRISERRLEILTKQADILKESIKYARRD